jgi:hypothetical protein
VLCRSPVFFEAATFPLWFISCGNCSAFFFHIVAMVSVEWVALSFRCRGTCVSWIYVGRLCHSHSRIERSVGAMHVLLWIRRFGGTWNVYFADFFG